MNKKSIITIILVTIVIVGFYVTYRSIDQESDMPAVIGDDETIVKVFEYDLDSDSKVENIAFTRYSPQPSVYLSNLYIKSKNSVSSAPLIGLYMDNQILDLNGNKDNELIIYSVSGQLISTQLFSYVNKELIELKWKVENEEVTVWSSGNPAIEDLDRDGVFEIIASHKLRGERLTEMITVKDFYRWTGEHYEKYKEEKTVEGAGFGG